MDTTKLNRRDFLKYSALAGIGGALFPSQVLAQLRARYDADIITVIGLVDVAQALADGTVDGNCYWIDNHKSNGSYNEGTEQLVTKVAPGDTILWAVSGLQVETVVSIVDGYGDAISVTNPTLVNDLYAFSYWVGTVTSDSSGLYQYNVGLQVESQKMFMTSPLSLDVV